MVALAVIMVFRSLLRTKRKIRKDTKPLGHKSVYQRPGKNYSQKKATQGEQQNKVEIANKTKAQSEAAVKEHIKNFPEVKVEHIIDGDTVIVVKDWHKIRIRLDSIDCPEVGQYWGDISKYGLIKLN